MKTGVVKMADGGAVNPAEIPTVDIPVRETFGIETDMEIGRAHV